MKKYKLFVLCIAIGIGLCVGGYSMAVSKIMGPTLNANKAKELLGSAVFSEKAFKEASDQERGAMVADLLSKKKIFIGLSTLEVRTKLGDPTGYFWNDSIPAYIVNLPGADPKAPTDIWQVIFLPGKNQKVKDVVINKNCCD